MKKFNKFATTILFRKIGFISFYLALIFHHSFAQEHIPIIHTDATETSYKIGDVEGTKTITTTTIQLKGGDKYTVTYVVTRDNKKRILDSSRTVTTDRSDQYIDEFHYAYSRGTNGDETVTETTTTRDDIGNEEYILEKFVKKADDKYFKQTTGSRRINGVWSEENNSSTNEFKQTGDNLIPRKPDMANINRNRLGIVVNGLYNFCGCCSPCGKMPIIDYVRYMSPDFGIVAEAGYSTGVHTKGARTMKFSNYKFELGATFLPFHYAGLNDKFTISTFAQAGIENDYKKFSRLVTERSTSPTGGTVTSTRLVTNTHSDNSFIADIGGSLDWNISNAIHLRVLELTYNFFEHRKLMAGAGVNVSFH